MATKITEHYFEFGVNKYFRGNAHLLEIGHYGQKKDPIGPKAYVDPQNKVGRAYLVNRVRKGNPVSVDFDQTTKAELEVNGPIKVFGLNLSTSTGFSYEKARSANLKLFNLSIDEGPLKAMLNGDAVGARTYLADEGNDGRIVSEVWVVMEAELATHFDTSASISVAAKDGDLDVTAGGGSQGAQTITLSAGTTFAYKLHKVSKWNSGKTRIEDMEADYKGMS